MTSQQQLQHLYWRAGFGPRPEDSAAGLSPAKALRQLLRDAEKYAPIESPAFHYADPLGAVIAVQPTAPAPNLAAMRPAPPANPDELSPLAPRPVPVLAKQQGQDVKVSLGSTFRITEWLFECLNSCERRSHNLSERLSFCRYTSEYETDARE